MDGESLARMQAAPEGGALAISWFDVLAIFSAIYVAVALIRRSAARLGAAPRPKAD